MLFQRQVLKKKHATREKDINAFNKSLKEKIRRDSCMVFKKSMLMENQLYSDNVFRIFMSFVEIFKFK